MQIAMISVLAAFGWIYNENNEMLITRPTESELKYIERLTR